MTKQFWLVMRVADKGTATNPQFKPVISDSTPYPTREMAEGVASAKNYDWPGGKYFVVPIAVNIPGKVCTECVGEKRVTVLHEGSPKDRIDAPQRETTEVCKHCDGTGEEPEQQEKENA